MKNRISTIIIAFMAFVVLSGCTATNARRTNEVSSIKRGTVVSLQAVTLAGQSTGIGMASGSTAGVIIGARSGGSVRSMLVGALVGQVVGAIAGHTLENKLTEADGIEVSIRLENGDEIAIPQPRSTAEVLQVGDKVRVIQSGSKAIVEKA